MIRLLLIGDNDFEMAQFVAKEKSKFKDSHGEHSVVDIDCLESDLLTLQEAMQSQSLFDSGERLVIVSNLSQNKQIADYLSKSVDDIDTSVILKDSSIDKRSSLYKKFKKDNLVKEFTELKGGSLTNWVVSEASDLGGSIDGSSAQLIVSRVGSNQWQLKNELTKLIAFKKEITKDTVMSLTDESLEESVFNMLDSLPSGGKDKLLDSAKQLINTGNEPTYLLSMVIWYFHNLTVIASNPRLSDVEIAKLYKLSPYVVGKSRSVANRLSKNEYKEIFEKLVQTDFDFKNKNVDRKQSLLILLIELSNHFKQAS